MDKTLGRRLMAGQRTLDPPVVVRVHAPQPTFVAPGVGGVVKWGQMEALVVSAHPTMQAYLEVSLEAEGFNVVSFTNAAEALRYLKNHTPDLIVLDDEIKGGVSALDMAWRIKRVRRLKEVPVVVLSSSADQRTQVAARLARVDKLLVKPLTGGEFRAFARRTIEMRTRD